MERDRDASAPGIRPGRHPHKHEFTHTHTRFKHFVTFSLLSLGETILSQGMSVSPSGQGDNMTSSVTTPYHILVPMQVPEGHENLARAIFDELNDAYQLFEESGARSLY